MSIAKGTPEGIAPIGYVHGRPVWPIMGAAEEKPPEADDAALSLAPEAIRNSPEYRALAERNRTLARQAGDTRTQLEAARQDAEAQRLAAEAERDRAIRQQIESTLGPTGLAAWTEVAELSQTDQVAAARRFAELLQAQATAQSGAAAGQPPAADGAEAAGTEGAAVTTQTPPAPAPGTPPPPSSGLSGGQSLAQASTEDSVDQIVSGLEATYAGVVERNQKAGTRNRVTMRDRATAFIAYLGASYLKAGARAKSSR